jgi:hypothetical protein
MLKASPAILLSSLMLLQSGAAARAAGPTPPKPSTVTVPGGDSLEVTPPEGWSASTVQPDPSLPPTVRLTAPNKEASLQITFLSDKTGTFSTKEKLEKVVEKAAQQYVDGSVEKKIKLQSLDIPGGTCIYAEFTDSDLVGKTPPAGQFKIVGTGAMTLGKTIAAFTLLGDSVEAKAYLAAKQILKSGVALHK